LNVGQGLVDETETF